MKKQHFHYFNQIAMMLLFILTIFGCQQNNSINEPKISNDPGFHKDGGLRIPDTYVHGYVYKQGSTLQGATVKLYKGTTYLDQTTTSSSGYYEICVCDQHAGTGTYSVKASYSDRFGLWTDSEDFYWSTENGPWDFSINLTVILSGTK